jgi:hypothetical protein
VTPYGPALLLLTGSLLLPMPSGADNEAEDWLNSKSASDVNEGQLKFLANLPDKPVHHHHNHIVIAATSLADGWVKLDQCHRNLDAVPRAEIVFNPGRSRGLQVVRFQNIGKVWVEGASVQLRDVAHDAELCLRLESRALVNDGDGIYSLHNGPFMRRFLDGYYPMRVSMAVDYPDELTLADVIPAAQEGFEISYREGGLDLDARFEGRLNTVIRFWTTKTQDHLPTQSVP